MLVVAYATASARQVRFPSLRAMRNAGPTSPHERVENIGSVRSESRYTFMIDLNQLMRKSSLTPVFVPSKEKI